MYEFPKISVPVELTLLNGESLSGNIFLTEDLVSSTGQPRVEEFLNDDPDQFFSFQMAAGGYRLINKGQLVSVGLDQDDSETRHQTPLPPRILEVHFNNGSSMTGSVYPTQLEESRISDIVNQNEAFMVLFHEGVMHIINRELVVYICEAQS